MIVAVPDGSLPRNGVASWPACTLGLDDERNWALLGCVTLDKLGSMETPAIVPANHTATISQRNRTSNFAMAVNICVLPSTIYWPVPGRSRPVRSYSRSSPPGARLG